MKTLKKVNVLLNQWLVERLDDLAKSKTLSRSALLREIIIDSKNWIKKFYIDNKENHD